MAENRVPGKSSSRVSIVYSGGDELRISTESSVIKGFLPRDGVLTPSDVRDGSDPGFRPGELLLSSLGTCVAGMMAVYARSHQYPVDAISVTLTDTLAENPPRIGSIAVNVSLDGDLTSEQRDKLQAIAERCKISDTLKHSLEVVVLFDRSLPADAPLTTP